MVRFPVTQDRLVCTLPTIYMDNVVYKRFHIRATPHPVQIMLRGPDRGSGGPVQTGRGRTVSSYDDAICAEHGMSWIYM